MSNISESISKLSLEQLKKLIVELKLYKDLKKQLGNRGKKTYKKLKTGERSFLVEYYSSISEDLAWEKSSQVYKESFGLDIDREQVSFLSKESLKGGIKVYVDDKIVDLSYERIEKSITR